MLKKAAIVTAATTAGLLVASPLAMAGESHGHGHGKGHGEVRASKNISKNIVRQSGHNKGNAEQVGLVNLNDTNVQVPVQVCNNDIPVNVLGIQVPVQDIAAALGLPSNGGGGGGGAAHTKACAQAASSHDN